MTHVPEIDAAIGTRIVVRSRIGGAGPTGGPAMTDTVGRIVTIDSQTVVVERRNGAIARVNVADVVTWKPVPDRPLRRRRASDIDADSLTAITSRGWPPLETQMLGDWELRAAGGFTGRANSVAAMGTPGIDPDEAIARVVQWYAERSMPPLAQVVSGSPNQHTFANAGWTPGNGFRSGAVVQVVDLDPTYDPDPDVLIQTTLTDEWLALYGRVDEDMAAARAVIAGPAKVGFAQIGSPVEAIARVVVTGEWAGISAVEVVPQRRRHGLASRLVISTLAWAVQQGADKAYLQTMQDNTAALSLYEPFGFVHHHDYQYLQAPTSDRTSPARC